MIAEVDFNSLIRSIDFWRGVGQGIIDLALVYAMLITVLAISGETVNAWPLKRKPITRTHEATKPPADEAHETPAAVPRRRASEPHLEFLDQMRTALKYQGTTVVLVVFAVLLLGMQRVLSAAEIATILSGITGYVLGAQRNSPGQGQSTDTTTPEDRRHAQAPEVQPEPSPSGPQPEQPHHPGSSAVRAVDEPPK